MPFIAVTSCPRWNVFPLRSIEGVSIFTSRLIGARQLFNSVCLGLLAGVFAGCRPEEGDTRQELPPTQHVLANDETPTTTSSAVSQASGTVWFTDVTATTGIDFRHTSGASAEKPFPAANGSGCGALDYDRDGRCDLYFANGTTFPIDSHNTTAIDRCYRNLGQWQFADITEPARLGDPGYSAGVAVGDYDGDGFPDLYIVWCGRYERDRNRGDG